MKTALRMTSLFLCIIISAGLIACGGESQTTTGAATEPDSGVTATDAAPATEPVTETPATEAETTAATEAETTAPPKPDVADGMMIYYEDFSSYGDIDDTDGVIAALGWKIQDVFDDYAPSDWTASLRLENGELCVSNYADDGSFSGSDSYAMILDAAYMARAEKYGSYTLQYDVTYGTASNHKRYINFVTEYDGETYNSFHFRVGGYGNNQVYYCTKWHTYDAANEDDLFAAQKTTEDGLSTIAYKLLGRAEPLGDTYKDMFKDVTVTIRVIRVGGLADILMKTADMDDFVRVSRSCPDADGYGYAADLDGGAVCFKAGGAINGRVDNVAIWAGTGDMPADKTVTYVP
ncbi:MAG: hypothetical protein J5585_06835 [Clostridia bacterium]|nr:hypothetical protein [Clostridia bacterium]